MWKGQARGSRPSTYVHHKTGPVQKACSDKTVQAAVTRTEWEPTQHGNRWPQSSKEAEGYPCEDAKSMMRQTHKPGLFAVNVREIEGQQREPERRLRAWECILLRTQVWFSEPPSEAQPTVSSRDLTLSGLFGGHLYILYIQMQIIILRLKKRRQHDE